VRLPVTTPARTIVDLVIAKEEPSYVERAIREALGDRRLNREDLLQTAQRRRKRHAGLVAELTRMLDSAE
jgi:hypothetical protein